MSRAASAGPPSRLLRRGATSAPASQPPQEAPSALLARSPGASSGSAFVAAEPAGFAAVGFDLRSAAAAGAARRRALWRRAARLLGRRPQGCPLVGNEAGAAARARGRVRTRPVRRRSGTRHRGRRTPLRPAAIRRRRAPHVRSACAAGAHVRSGRAARARAARRFLRADAGAGIGPRRLAFRCPPGAAAPPPPIDDDLEFEEEAEEEARPPRSYRDLIKGWRSLPWSSSRSEACCCGSGRTWSRSTAPSARRRSRPSARRRRRRTRDRRSPTGSSPAPSRHRPPRHPARCPAPARRRRWCSTKRIPPIPTASASSARRSGGPRP